MGRLKSQETETKGSEGIHADSKMRDRAETAWSELEIPVLRSHDVVIRSKESVSLRHGS